MIEQDTGIIKLNNLWTLTCCLNEVIYIYIYIFSKIQQVVYY